MLAAVLFSLFVLLVPLAAQAQEPLPVPEPSAVLTITGTLNGQTATPSRYLYNGAAWVARCAAMVDPTTPEHAQVAGAVVGTLLAINPEITGEIMLHCDGFSVVPIDANSAPVPVVP